MIVSPTCVSLIDFIPVMIYPTEPILLRECGVKEIVHIGMAFFGKRVKVKYKVVKN